MFRRSIFRRFIKIFRADTELHEKIESGDLQWARFSQALEWARTAESVYKNKRQRQGMMGAGELDTDSVTANILALVAYRYSKKAMEAFFRNDELRYLFMHYAEKLKDEGYGTCEGRHYNRTDSQKGTS